MSSAFAILASGITAAMVIATVGLMFYLVIRAFKSGGSSKRGETDADETRIIQEIYTGLQRMEARVESLETILMKHEEGQRERDKEARFERELRD